jgi:hypothetical protein
MIFHFGIGKKRIGNSKEVKAQAILITVSSPPQGLIPPTMFFITDKVMADTVMGTTKILLDNISYLYDHKVRWNIIDIIF